MYEKNQGTRFNNQGSGKKDKRHKNTQARNKKAIVNLRPCALSLVP